MTNVLARFLWFSVALMVLGISLVLTFIKTREEVSRRTTTTQEYTVPTTIKSINIPSTSIIAHTNITLYYVETGDLSENAYPVLQFHPTPGSLLFRHDHEDSLLKQYGIRLIKIDRSNLYKTQFCCATKSEQFIQYECIYKHLIQNELKLKSYSVLGYQMGGFMALNHYHVLSSIMNTSSSSSNKDSSSELISNGLGGVGLDSIAVIAPFLPPIPKTSKDSNYTSWEQLLYTYSCPYTLLYRMYQLLGDKLAYKILNPLWKVTSTVLNLVIPPQYLTRLLNQFTFHSFNDQLSQNILAESTRRVLMELHSLSTLFEEYNIVFSHGLKSELKRTSTTRSSSDSSSNKDSSGNKDSNSSSNKGRGKALPHTLILVTSKRQEEMARSFLLNDHRDSSIMIQRVQQQDSTISTGDASRTSHSSLNAFVSEYERALSFIARNKPSIIESSGTTTKKETSTTTTTIMENSHSRVVPLQQQQQSDEPSSSTLAKTTTTPSSEGTTTTSSSSSTTTPTTSQQPATSTSSSTTTTTTPTTTTPTTTTPTTTTPTTTTTAPSSTTTTTSTTTSTPNQKTIAVIGGGLAGLSAAIEAAELGAKVYLLEKEDRTGGNSAKATSGINGIHTHAQKSLSIDDSFDLFYSDTTKSGKNQGNPKLVSTLVSESTSAIEFLEKHGIGMELITQCGGHSRPRTHRSAPPKVGRAMNVGSEMTTKLLDYIQKNLSDRVKVLTKCQMIGFICNEEEETMKDEKTIHEKTIHESTNKKIPIGIRYTCHSNDNNTTNNNTTNNNTTNTTTTQSLFTSSIIMTTGGYAADRNGYLKQYAPQLSHLPTTNGAFANGDGIRMCVNELNASLIHMESIQVHPTGFIDPQNPKSMSVFLAAEALRAYGGIIVNQNGERFCDELGRRDYVSEMIFKHCQREIEGGHVTAYLLMNDYVAKSFSESLLGFYLSKGFIRKYNHLEHAFNETLKMAAPNMNYETLVRTMIQYNSFYEASRSGSSGSGGDGSSGSGDGSSGGNDNTTGSDGGSSGSSSSNDNNTTNTPNTASAFTDPFGKTLFPTKFSLNDTIYISRITPSIHYTHGGLVFDEKGRVLRKHGDSFEVIPNLYTAGEASGGLHGLNRLAGNSLLECVVFGRIAAHDIMKK